MFAFTRNSFSLTSVAKRRLTKRCGATARDRQRYAISTISRRSERRRLNRNLRRTVSFCQQRARETRFLLGAGFFPGTAFPAKFEKCGECARTRRTLGTYARTRYSTHACTHTRVWVGRRTRKSGADSAGGSAGRGRLCDARSVMRLIALRHARDETCLFSSATHLFVRHFSPASYYLQ